jgi:hypothetical protein
MFGYQNAEVLRFRHYAKRKVCVELASGSAEREGVLYLRPCRVLSILLSWWFGCALVGSL